MRDAGVNKRVIQQIVVNHASPFKGLYYSDLVEFKRDFRDSLVFETIAMGRYVES